MNPDNYKDVYITPLIQFSEEDAPIPIPEKIKQKTTTLVPKEIKLAFVSNLYFGSLTVVGLFILFRFIQKSR
jgi:hypothetical protein